MPHSRSARPWSRHRGSGRFGTWPSAPSPGSLLFLCPWCQDVRELSVSKKTRVSEWKDSCCALVIWNIMKNHYGNISNIVQILLYGVILLLHTYSYQLIDPSDLDNLDIRGGSCISEAEKMIFIGMHWEGTLQLDHTYHGTEMWGCNW